MTYRFEDRYVFAPPVAKQRRVTMGTPRGAAAFRSLLVSLKRHRPGTRRHAGLHATSATSGQLHIGFTNTVRQDSARPVGFFSGAHRALSGSVAGADSGGVYISARNHPASTVAGEPQGSLRTRHLPTPWQKKAGMPASRLWPLCLML
jgi:hypothetical protein